MRWTVIAIVAVLAGCKKKSSGSAEAIAKMDEFATKMCHCNDHDKVCAEKVNDDMTKWGMEMAKTSEKEAKPDPDLAKRAADIMTKYTECMTKIMMATGGDSRLEEPMGTWKLPPVPKSPTVDLLLKAARDSASAQNKSLALAKVEAKYTRSDGSLDPTYGTLVVSFGQPDEKDDPNRPIGAPVPEPKDRLTLCPTWTFTKGAWQGDSSSCTTALAPVRCNLSQIWKRAIKDDAPAAALATITLSQATDGQAWTFGITDQPRKIDISRAYADDCEPVVEQPR